jgi:hypothetical protein
VQGGISSDELRPPNAFMRPAMNGYHWEKAVPKAQKRAEGAKKSAPQGVYSLTSKAGI